MINEDVIATSAALCSHIDGVQHIFCTMDDGEADNNYVYEYDSVSGKLEYQFPLADFALPIFGITSDGWWYLTDEESDWTKCEDQSNDAHPIKKPD